MIKKTQLNSDKMRKIFCRYALFFPPLCFLLHLLYAYFDIPCGDSCYVSPLLHYFVLFSFFIIAAISIFLYALSKKQLINKGVCLWSTILNCLYCSYWAFISINSWFSLLLLFPGIITIPIQLILLKKLWKKNKDIFFLHPLYILSFLTLTAPLWYIVLMIIKLNLF